MDNWTFGLSMLIVGMGGTLLTLIIMSWSDGCLEKNISRLKKGKNKQERRQEGSCLKLF